MATKHFVPDHDGNDFNSTDGAATEYFFDEEGEEVSSIFGNSVQSNDSSNTPCCSREYTGFVLGMVALLAFCTGVASSFCLPTGSCQPPWRKPHIRTSSAKAVEVDGTVAPTAAVSAIQVGVPTPAIPRHTEQPTINPTTLMSSIALPVATANPSASNMNATNSPAISTVFLQSGKKQPWLTQRPTAPTKKSEEPRMDSVTFQPTLSTEHPQVTTAQPSTLFNRRPQPALQLTTSPTTTPSAKRQEPKIATVQPSTPIGSMKRSRSSQLPTGISSSTPFAMTQNPTTFGPTEHSNNLPPTLVPTPLLRTATTSNFNSGWIPMLTNVPSSLPPIPSTMAPTFISQGSLILLPFLAEVYQNDTLVVTEHVELLARNQEFGLPNQAITLRYTGSVHVVDHPVELMIEMWYGWEAVKVFINNEPAVSRDANLLLNVGPHMVVLECRGLPGRGIQFNAALFAQHKRVVYTVETAGEQVEQFLQQHGATLLVRPIHIVHVEVAGSDGPYLETVIDASQYSGSENIFLILSSSWSVNWVILQEEGSAVTVRGVAYTHRPASKVRGVDWSWPVTNLPYQVAPGLALQTLVGGREISHSVVSLVPTELVTL